jgi:hypothetical protein
VINQSETVVDPRRDREVQDLLGFPTAAQFAKGVTSAVSAVSKINPARQTRLFLAGRNKASVCKDESMEFAEEICELLIVR